MAEKLFKGKLDNIPKVSAGWGSNDSLGMKIEKMFTRYTQSVILWGYEFFAELMVQIFDASMKILKPGMERMFNAVFDEYLKDPAFPPEIKGMLDRVKKEEGESAVIGMALSAITMIVGVFMGGLEPFGRRLGHITDVLVRSYVPSPNELAMFERLGLINSQVAQKAYWNNGVPEEFLPAIKEMSRNMLDVGEIMAGRWRKLLTNEDFISLLKRRGYDDKAVAVLDDLSKLIPPISDLIRFQVREAFNDVTSNKFGYDADYPSELDQYIERQGYDKDWGRRFWRAHWDLPSATQAYEMLHRGEITAQDLDDLLKTKDYPVFWRERLKNISYNVLTRVDVRRLIQAGMIDRDKAKKSYLSMGYNEEDAELLTEFAYKGISQDERDLTKSEIIGMYEDGLMAGSDVEGALVKMGYDTEEAAQLLKQADFNIAKAARTDTINYVKERFAADQINRAQAQSDLANAGLKGNSIDRYLLNWERAKTLQVKPLSLADLRRMYPKGIINEQEFRDGLKILQYSENAITKLIQEAAQDVEGLEE